MPKTATRYPKIDVDRVRRKYRKVVFARRGQALFSELIEPNLKKKDHGRFVALDIETGAFEIADSRLQAVDALREKRPDSQTWVERIGYRAAVKFGGRSISRKSPA